MGDRVVMQVVKRDPVNGDEFGPILYSHWGGAAVRVIIRAFKAGSSGLRGDLHCLSAQLLCEMAKVSGRVAVWNTDKVADASNSHGDRGVVLIDADTFACTLFDSDFQIGEDGVPFDPTATTSATQSPD